MMDGHMKTIEKLFDSLCGKYSRWEVWQDFIVMSATAISNAADHIHADRREENFRKIAAKYSASEHHVFAKMLSEVVMGLDENSDQDLLGTLYMNLNLGNDHAGQFFTPYNVCRMMAGMTYGCDLADQFKGKEWISCNDCASGAGATLIAFANECRRNHINYQTDVLFVAQDIDYICACMCYIQLSLLGCAGYVVVGDTLANPSVCYDSTGLLPIDSGNVWYTPMFNSNVWIRRRLMAQAEVIDYQNATEEVGA